jgi:RNA polymerase primary sigma factor
MDREILFAKTLEEVKNTAREQGNSIRKEQVEEAFAELELNEQQMEMVYDYLSKHKIGIGEPIDLDEYLTDKEKNYLQNYLDELELLPEYTAGEKKAYTMAAMAGETDAQNKLTEIYLRDVVDVAKLYTGQGVFLEDLIGEGNLALAFGTGMLGSLEKPEEADGMLIKLVMDAMEDFIAENADSDKVNKRALDRVNKVLDKAKELSEALGRNVTVAELSEETKMSEKTIRDAMRISGYKIDYIEG